MRYLDGNKNISSTSDLKKFGFHQLVEAMADLSSVELDNLENILIKESIFQFLVILILISQLEILKIY
ncbi:Uncharacterised protein [Rodentibacter pneumotropicus]|uniref:Uncharacterized protein n=1 Tax=Rodentibacter pneumotropicus TaxID=758 RepID=A0A3S4XV31_9PAST|nr:Uncharacterised protein [Rodentibacter pneumotropicus]